MKKLFPLFALCFLFFTHATSAMPKIDNKIEKALKKNDVVKVVIMVDDSNITQYLSSDIVANYFNYDNMTDIIRYIHDETQKNLFSTMTMQKQDGSGPITYPVSSLWNVNAVVAYVNRDGLKWLAARPDVRSIVYDDFIELFEDPVGSGNADYTYGLKNIGVQKLREAFPNITGKGVVAGVVDSGITAHPDLVNKLYRFKDALNPENKEPKDYDTQSFHGTHVSGTIVGNATYGIAPDATLAMAATIAEGATLSTLLTAMQWIMDPDENPETTDQPRMVNNSWGFSVMPSDDVAQPVYKALTAWEAANIVPVFAAGNSGQYKPPYNKISFPQNFPATFTVGAVDKDDKIASFSSRGKPLYYDKEQMKPEISAPGVDVLSAGPNGGYHTLSGTSMSCPHVVGAMALLFQIKPDLTVQDIRDLLTGTTKDLGSEGWDNAYGYGRLDVYAAALKLSK
jgi:subtilisin family serine protease